MDTEQKLKRWQEAGLLDQETAERISAFEKRQPAPKKLPLLLMIGLIFFSLAIFSFIAANWQAIPDLAKVLLMLALMWIFYSIAYFSEKKDFGYPLLFRVIGLAMFGATLLVAAQTFHFPAGQFPASLGNVSGCNCPLFLLAASHLFRHWIFLRRNRFGIVHARYRLAGVGHLYRHCSSLVLLQQKLRTRGLQLASAVRFRFHVVVARGL